MRDGAEAELPAVAPVRPRNWLARMWEARPPTLAEGLASRQDNFLLLRMIAASMVIYGHAPAITGGPHPRDLFAWLGWGTYSGSIAVSVFFIISGFMVTGSFVRNPDPWRYLRARTLRIFPAYAVCVLLCAMVLGAIYTTLPLSRYFTDHETFDYLTRNLQFSLQWTLPGVFQDNPKRHTINGSLWTLPAELRMYVWVLGLGMLGLLGRRGIANATLFALAVVAFAAPGMLPGFPVHIWFKLGVVFALGAAAYVNRVSIPASGRLLCVLALAAWMLRRTPFYETFLVLALASFVFWFAYRTRWFGYNRFGDYSYGTYLWGFPVQQTLAHHFPGMGALEHTLTALPIAIGLGVVSWKLVEAPAIALGKRDWLKRWRRQIVGSADRGD